MGWANDLYGESKAKFREVFDEAKVLSPSVIVLDDVGAICPRRDEGGGGGAKSRRHALDSTRRNGPRWSREGVMTTKFTVRINGVLRRPGQFDREIKFGEVAS
jgi:AAA family ATPase